VLRELLSSPDVTEVCELRGRIGLMAFHGGNLERTTDVVAREVASRTGSSLYAVLQAAPLRKHLPSTAFRPDHSEALAAFLDHVDVAIAIHGYGRTGLWWHLLLGGRNRAFARHLAQHLESGLPKGYEVVDDLDQIPRELRGQHARNPVNLPSLAGVQIELPPTVRWNHDEAGWSDHAGIGRAVQTDHLIDALSAGVDAWLTSEPALRSEETPD
jgi:phage replication-related protein YjqB (UPF0714/DUF867 family)